MLDKITEANGRIRDAAAYAERGDRVSREKAHSSIMAAVDIYYRMYEGFRTGGQARLKER